MPWVRIVLVTLCAFGVVVNGFVLFVLLYAKQSQPVSSKMLIVNQTVADLLCCLTIVISTVAATQIHEYTTLSGAVVICVLFHSSVLIAVCDFASVINLVLLTLERYFKIVSQTSRSWS